MNARSAWGFLTCITLAVCTGCANSQTAVRSQNANLYSATCQQPLQPIAITHCDPGLQAAYGDPVCENCQPGNVEQPQEHGCCGNHCHGLLAPLHHHHRQCDPNDPNCGWRPTHRHWFSYEPPTDLVYPPANQPAAVVQYPYYTVKGPDDFFLK